MDYKYVAISQSNALVRGSVSASTEEVAEERLTNFGMKVISLEMGGARAVRIPGLTLKSTKVSRKEVTIFSQQLASLIEAGVPLLMGLQLLREQAKSDAFKTVLRSMAMDLGAGQSLNQAMRSHPKVFPVVYTRLVEAGERSGTLDVVLNHLAAYLTGETAMVGKVKKALTYPAIVGVVGTVVMAILVMFVLPAMTDMLKAFNVPMPLITRIVIAVSDIGRRFRVEGLVGMIALVVGSLWYFRKPSGRLALHRFLLKAPMIGQVTVQVNLGRSSQTIALLLGSGMPLPEGLALAIDGAPNLAFQEGLRQVRADVVSGKSLAQAMAAVIFIPSLYTQMVRIGEESGTLEKNLKSMANFYEREVSEQLDTLTGLLEPVLTVVMGVGVGFLALAMLLPMMSVLSSVGS